ncbi:hypothetical protein BGW38_003676 [Lunasporangiospora selenospora]|uniref:Uncharacterized protein n=1 Tax=Lunasporangiospora selenospora TaxID=979761 RepID=A0A9P6FQC2_9FUNG|nr:hypothetical protein BGW38_003676 [Lunasporangiospora selenospora]
MAFMTSEIMSDQESFKTMASSDASNTVDMKGTKSNSKGVKGVKSGLHQKSRDLSSSLLSFLHSPLPGSRCTSCSAARVTANVNCIGAGASFGEDQEDRTGGKSRMHLIGQNVEEDEDQGTDDEPIEDEFEQEVIRRLTRQPLSHLSLNAIVAKCTSLQSLVLHCDRDGIGHGIIDAIQSLPVLDTMEIYANRVVKVIEKSCKSGQVCETIGSLDIHALLDAAPNLSSLSLRGSAFSFQQLSEQRRKPLGETTRTDPFYEAISMPSETKIRRLSLDTHSANEQDLLALLSLCADLEVLHLPGGLSWEWSNHFIETLAKSCPRLETFTINASSGRPVSDDRLTALVRGLCKLPIVPSSSADSTTTLSAMEGEYMSTALGSQTPSWPSKAETAAELAASVQVYRPLKSFGARACHFGDSTLDAIEAYLEDPEEEQNVEGDGASQFSGSFDVGWDEDSEVEVEAAQMHWTMYPSGLGQAVEEGGTSGLGESHISGASSSSIAVISTTLPRVQRPVHARAQWGCCDTLTELTIGFTTPDRTTTKSYAIYSLLSGFTNLEHLHLAYTCLSLTTPVALDGSQTTATAAPSTSSSSNLLTNKVSDAISFVSTTVEAQERMETGFDRLRTLRRLRTFSIETCAYPTITRADLAWMVAHWPRLERFFINLPGAAKERQFNTWLDQLGRPDVQIQSRQTLLF